MGDRCTGHCCKNFFLPFEPGRLYVEAANHKRWKAWLTEHRANIDMNDRSTWTPQLDGTTPPANARASHYEEIEQIADLAIYVGYLHPVTGEEAGEGRGWYSCRHLQSNGDCGIYDSRPRMCRDYPYGQACKDVACTHDAAREGRLHMHRNLLRSNCDNKIGLRVLTTFEAHRIEHPEAAEDAEVTALDPNNYASA